MWRVENKGGTGGYLLFIYMQQAMTIRSRMGWNKDNSQNDEGGKKNFSNQTNLKGLKLDKANYKISSKYEFGLQVFFLAISGQQVYKIYPTKNKNNPTEETEAVIPDDKHTSMQHVQQIVVARSSRRICELDKLSLRDLVKRQCTARLSTRRTTETITLPRTDEQPTHSRRIDVKAQTG